MLEGPTSTRMHQQEKSVTVVLLSTSLPCCAIYSKYDIQKGNIMFTVITHLKQG